MAKFSVELRCVQCGTKRTAEATGDPKKDFEIGWPPGWEPVVRMASAALGPFEALCPKHAKR